jgi:hypothetical protein
MPNAKHFVDRTVDPVEREDGVTPNGQTIFCIASRITSPHQIQPSRGLTTEIF